MQNNIPTTKSSQAAAEKVLPPSRPLSHRSHLRLKASNSLLCRPHRTGRRPTAAHRGPVHLRPPRPQSQNAGQHGTLVLCKGEGRRPVSAARLPRPHVTPCPARSDVIRERDSRHLNSRGGSRTEALSFHRWRKRPLEPRQRRYFRLAGDAQGPEARQSPIPLTPDSPSSTEPPRSRVSARVGESPARRSRGAADATSSRGWPPATGGRAEASPASQALKSLANAHPALRRRPGRRACGEQSRAGLGRCQATSGPGR